MRKLLCTAITGLALLLPTAALAEPSADDRAVARSLFEQGRTLMKDGKFAEATPKLEESQRLDAGVGTLFNLADCYEHLDRFASAWAAFAEAADLAKRAGQEDRAQIARERATSLLPKVSRMRVRMPPPLPAGLELRYDDKPLSTAILDTDMPVDAGEHRIRVSAPGKVSVEKRLRFEIGSATANVDLPALADVPPEPVVIPIGPARPEQAPPPPSTSSWQKPAAIATGVGAVVGLGLGTIFGLEASGEWSDAQKGGCPGACTDAGYRKWEDSKSSATVGTVGFVAGGVLAAAAIVLFVMAPAEKPSPPLSARAR